MLVPDRNNALIASAGGEPAKACNRNGCRLCRFGHVPIAQITESAVYAIMPPLSSIAQKSAVPKKSKEAPIKPTSELLKASYNAGAASGRLEAIEESMDSVAGLIFKAEAMIAGLGDNPDKAIQNNADHTLRALQLAFAAVTGSVNGSPAFRELLEQSRLRLQTQASATRH